MNSDDKHRGELDAAKRAQLFLDVSGAAIVMLEADNTVQLINRKGCEILGYPESEVIGKNWLTFLPERVREEMEQILDGMIQGHVDTVDLYNIPILTMDGKERILSWHSTIVVDKHGINRVVLGSGIDITEHLKTEDDLRSAIKTSLFYLDLMSHDFKNKLQGIMLASELIRFSINDTNTESLLDEISLAINYCNSLIKKVSSTNLFLQTPLHTISLTETLLDCIEEIKIVWPEVEFHCDIKDDEIFIEGNLFLRILLINIIENAIIHNPNPQRRVWISLINVETGSELSISDNGKGISNPLDFTEASHRTFGVGLHQAKQIIERHQGRIDIEDRVPGQHEKGARFILWFQKIGTRLKTV